MLKYVSYCEAVSIKDINKVLTREDTSILVAIIDKEFTFHKAHLDISQSLSLPIRIFESEQQYKQYQKKISKTSKSSNGFYSSSKKEMVINKNKHYLKIIVHEAQHFILRSKFENPPKWINEGLSEFYENAYINGSRIFVREQTRKRKRLEKWLQEKSLPDMSDFLALSNDDWKIRNTNSEHRSSTISWGLIYFLMGTQEGRAVLSGTIEELNRETDKTVEMILDNFYEGGVDALERDFRLFIQRVPSEQEI